MPTKLLISNYEYETGEGSVLGEGTYSKVRLCTNKATGKQVAVKIMNVEQLREEKAEQQVRREVSIAKLLDHPNVVQMYECIDDGKNLYVILEYVNGGDVGRKLTKGKLSEEEARSIFQQLIVGLRYCHVHHRIAHRDLKPENMLVDATTGLIKISDFGLANVAQPDSNGPSRELMQTVCGTATYSAPEVLKEMGYDGMTADVWSCGVILFQLLSGELPFNDDNIPTLYNKIERADYRFPRTFSEGAKTLIGKILVPDPKQRCTLDQIIRDPWFAVGFDEKQLTVGNVAPPPTEAAVAQAVARVQPVAEVPDDAFSLIFSMLATNFSDLVGKGGQMLHNSKRFTFIVRADPAATRTHLINTMSNMTPKANNNDKGTNPFEIKGFRSMTKGLLTFSGNLTPTISPNITVVVMKWGRGDLADFEAHVRGLVQALGPLASGIGARPPVQ